LSAKPITASLARLASFALTVGVGTIVGLISIPVITGIAGAQIWSVQAMAQSVSIMFGILVAFGWGTTGPSMIASTNKALRPQLFLDSLVSRGYLFLIAAPAMAAVMIVLQPEHVLLVVVASIAYLLPFLGGNWYFIGEAKPKRLFFLDALPQFSGTLVGLAILALTHNIVWLVATQLLFNILALTLTCLVIIQPSKTTIAVNFNVRQAFSRLAMQRHGVVTTATGSLYVNLPLVAINLFLPAQLGVYLMADRIFRYGVLALSPLLQFIQGWIPEGGPENLRHRLVRSAQVAPLFGFLGGMGIFLLGPLASEILSNGLVIFPSLLSAAVGLMFFSVAVSQILGLACLVSVGQGKILVQSTVLGAVCGAPAIVLAALFTDVTGVAWAVAISEILVAAYQGRALRRYFVKNRGIPASANHEKL
jgi:O-antigen/teichoic acid export membrane protein